MNWWGRHELVGPASPSMVDCMMRVVPMAAKDRPSVRLIYEAGMTSGNAAFETEAPPWDNWNAAHRHDLRFAAVDRDRGSRMDRGQQRLRPVLL